MLHHRHRFVLVFLILLVVNVKLTFSQTGTVPTGTDPACPNGISFYQKVYGGTLKEDWSECIIGTPDSGFVITGHSRSFGAGGDDALLMKVDKKGNLVWSKAIGGSNDDRFYGIKPTTDNGFIITGQTKSFGNAAGDALLVKVDGAGNVQWSKKYGNGNVNGDVAFDLVQLSDGGYAFCGANQYGPGTTQSWVVRTDNQGVVLWSKLYGHSGSDEAWGLTENGNSLVVVGWYIGNSFYDGYIMKLDKTNGAIQWIKGYDAENRSLLPAKINVTASGYQVFSLLMDDYIGTGQQQCIWNVALDGTVQQVTKLVIPGSTTSSYGWITLPDGGYIAANGQNNTGADVYLTRVNANGTVGWSKKFGRAGYQSIRYMATAADGGYAAVGLNNNAGSVADSVNIYLLKTDVNGDAASCSGIPTSDVTVTNPSFSMPGTSASPADLSLNNPVISITVNNFIPVTHTLCFECKPLIPTLPPDLVCVNGISNYEKFYGGNNKDDIGEWIAPTADSGYIVAGQTNSFGNGAYDGLLMKVDKKGATVWTRAIGGSNDDRFYSIKPTSDNGFVALGQTKSFGNSAGDVWLVKTDASGTIQWSKKYGNGNANGESGFEVIQLSDGGYAFCAAHQYGSGVTQSWVIRTDNQGVVLWSKQYGHAASDEAWGLTEDGNALVVVGWKTGSSFYDGYVMKLDKLNGAVQWIKGYDAENRSTLMTKIKVVNGGYQVFSLVMDDYIGTGQQQCIWNLGSDGTVQNVRKLNVPGTTTSSYGWYPMPDGSFVAANGANTNSADVLLTRVNANGSIGWSRKFVRTGMQSVRALIRSAEGGLIGTGITNSVGTAITSDSSNIYLLKVDSLGNGGICSGINTTEVTISNPTFTTPSFSISAAGDVVVNNPVINPGVSSVIPMTSTLCFYCQPKPTGSGRPVVATPTGHLLTVYPNPVTGSQVNILINALYDDRAIISIVNLQGTIIGVLASKNISAGNNFINVPLPDQLQRNSNYYIQVKYLNYANSVQVFVGN